MHACMLCTYMHTMNITPGNQLRRKHDTKCDLINITAHPCTQIEIMKKKKTIKTSVTGHYDLSSNLSH